MPSNYTTDDLVFGQIDLDDKFIKDTWLIDRFNGTSLWGYGNNTNGQLGNNTTATNYSSPVQIGSLTNWKQVVTGYFHFIALKTDNTLWGCGANNYGQVVASGSYSSPIQIGALTNWSQIGVGDSWTTAIKTDGTLWAWGYDLYGELGNNVIGVAYTSPLQIGVLTNWKQVGPGGDFNTAIKTDGTLWAWGNNQYGMLGNNTLNNYSSPIQIGSLTNWKQTTCSYYNCAAIKTDGTLWAWGWNPYGQLGNNTVTNYSSPIQIGSLTNWAQAVFSDSHFLATKTDGTLWACGVNDFGQLGNNTRTYYSSPIQIGALTDWKSVAVQIGGSASFAIKKDGTLWVWGSDYIGTYSSPVQVGAMSNWKNISSWGYNRMAIKFDDIK